ncbi:MAG: hypothetical protein ACPL3C_00355 [Pyrobaculum sp.]
MATSINSIDELVRAYFRRLEELGLGEWVDKVFPTSETFAKISAMSGRSAEEVVEQLARGVVDKIQVGVAEEVVGAPREVAVWLLARRLAMWYLQLAVELGVVRER